MTTWEELVAAVIAAARDKDDAATLPCAEAFALAKRLAVPVSDIGRVCNEQDVKITGCQLGCF